MQPQPPSSWLVGSALVKARAQSGSAAYPPDAWTIFEPTPSALTVIASRPAMGKTALALHLARTHAVEHGRPTAVVSPFSPPDMVVSRLLAGISGVPVGRIRCDLLSRGAREQVEAAEARLQRSPLYLECTRALSHQELRDRVLALRDSVGVLDLLVVDEPEALHGDSPWALLADLAAELGCAVVTTARLSRAVDERDDHRPTPRDLIDRLARRHADALCLLYREEYYDSEAESPGLMEVRVERSRWPSQMLVVLECELETGVFRDRI